LISSDPTIGAKTGSGSALNLHHRNFITKRRVLTYNNLKRVQSRTTATMRRAWQALILSLALLISTIGAEGSWQVICQMPVETRLASAVDSQKEGCESACCETTAPSQKAVVAEEACCPPEQTPSLTEAEQLEKGCYCSVEVDRFGLGGNALDRSKSLSENTVLAEAPLRLPISLPVVLPDAEPIDTPTNEPLPDDPVRLPGGTRAPPVA
jgi:hypothetical protein